MSRAPALAVLQRRVQTQVVQGSGEIEALIFADEIADACTRFGIYANAYRLRLLEVLRGDYPVLLAQLGAEKFERLGRGYIDAHPSDTPSVRWFGRHLAEHLRRVQPQRPALAEIATFEWSQGEVFDAPDAATVTLDDMAGILGAAWATMRVLPHPSVRSLELHSNAPAFAKAFSTGQRLPKVKYTDTPTTWVLWRKDFDIHWRAISIEEAAAFDAVRDNAGFGEICERLCEWIDPDAVALHAAGLLKRWISDAMVAEIELD